MSAVIASARVAQNWSRRTHQNGTKWYETMQKKKRLWTIGFGTQKDTTCRRLINCEQQVKGCQMLLSVRATEMVWHRVATRTSTKWTACRSTTAGQNGRKSHGESTIQVMSTGRWRVIRRRTPSDDGAQRKSRKRSQFALLKLGATDFPDQFSVPNVVFSKVEYCFGSIRILNCSVSDTMRCSNPNGTKSCCLWWSLNVHMIAASSIERHSD